VCVFFFFKIFLFERLLQRETILNQQKKR